MFGGGRGGILGECVCERERLFSPYWHDILTTLIKRFSISSCENIRVLIASRIGFKFDVVSCQLALHYMMQSKEKVRGCRGGMLKVSSCCQPFLPRF